MKNIFNTPREIAQLGQSFNLLTVLRVLHDNEENRYYYSIPTRGRDMLQLVWIIFPLVLLDGWGCIYSSPRPRLNVYHS